jgi:aspartyl-tRNA(Asn)/glutamyl-tRNA(Gln) amidotransferase subunit A
MYKLSIKELNKKLAAKEISAAELAKYYLNRAKNLDSKYEAFVTFNDSAVAQASAITSIDNILAGIPLGIKDNINTKGLRTTCSSKMLENYVPPYNATVMEKLNSKNIVNIGKLNMDEFAMGSSTESSFYKKTKNPHDITKVPGGSSGGSAASVAARQVVAALGSDTGGSIRQPAAFCGVVGMKPTYGLVSRYGLIAFASSLDQIGPISTTVEDNAILMEAIAGADLRDSTSNQKLGKIDYTSKLAAGVKGKKVGIIRDLMSEQINPQILEKVNNAVKILEKNGAVVDYIDMPNLKYGLSVYYIIAPAEASANLARFDGVRFGYRSPSGKNLNEMYEFTRAEGFGSEVKRRIMLGTYTLSSGFYDAYYLKAQKVRKLISDEFHRAFSQFDLLISPTTPTTAFGFDAKSSPLEMYLADICTIPTNLAGIPTISIPVGFDDANLPVGMQIFGNAWQEELIYQASYVVEQELKLDLLPKE